MILNAFILNQKDCDNILCSTESWSIQNINTKKRGLFAISYSGQNLIYGEAELTDVILLTKELYDQHKGLHKHEETWEELTAKFNHPYAWVFINSTKFAVPILSNNPVSSSGLWIRNAIDDSMVKKNKKTMPNLKTQKLNDAKTQKTLVSTAIEARNLGVTYGEYSIREQCQGMSSVYDKIQLVKNSGQYMTVRERMKLKEHENI